MQIESAKLSAAQDRKLEKMNEVLEPLLEWAEQQQLASQENMRFSKIAAWSSIVAVVLTAIGIIVQISLR